MKTKLRKEKKGLRNNNSCVQHCDNIPNFLLLNKNMFGPLEPIPFLILFEAPPHAR